MVEIGLLTELPPFKGGIKTVMSSHEGGLFHFDDHFADGVMIVEDGKFHLMWHPYQQQSPQLTGGSYLSKEYDGDPTQWGAVSGGIFNSDIAIPQGAHSTNANNTDTFVLVKNPTTGIWTSLYGASPGEAGEYAGVKYTVQRATAATPSPDPADWTRYGAEQIIESDAAAEWTLPFPENSTPPQTFNGGNYEPSVLYDPDIGMVVFWEGFTSEPELPLFGDTHRRRNGRAVCPIEDWDTTPSTSLVWTPAAADDSYVFSPDEHGMKPGETYGSTNGTAKWGTHHCPQHAHFSINPWDGVYHRISLGQKPNTVISVENRSAGIGHWYSLDKGLTWIGDSKNPIITWDSMGFSNLAIANKFNSPFLLWDKPGRKAYLCFWANDDGVYEVGTRLYMLELALTFGTGGRAHRTGVAALSAGESGTRVRRWERILKTFPGPHSGPRGTGVRKVLTGKQHRTGAKELFPTAKGPHLVPPKNPFGKRPSGKHGVASKPLLTGERPRTKATPTGKEKPFLGRPGPHRKGGKGLFFGQKPGPRGKGRRPAKGTKRWDR